MQTLGQLTTQSYSAFRLRIGASGLKSYDNASQLAAIAEFYRAYRTVPAYREFIDSQGGVPKRFSQIPVMTKKNYIQPAVIGDVGSVYVNGEIPPGAIRDTSTGTSGIPTPWYRGASETKRSRSVMNFRATAILKNQPYFFINGFALGPWATGITTALGVATDKNAIISNIGPNTAEILKVIKEAVKAFPGRAIIVAGYPPHMQELVDLAVQEDFPLHKHQILAVVGGKSMSETQRDLILKAADGSRTGLTKVYSFYGASDLDINVAFETDFEVALRKAALANPKLAQDLFGKHPFIPMIFHYDPMTCFLEQDAEGNLLFTNVVGDRISPRIRYDLGDKGSILPVKRALEILKAHGIDLGARPNTNLPLVFIWGRVDSYITYRAANVSPENLGEALLKTGYSASIRDFGFWQHEENGATVTEILVQPDDGTKLGASDEAFYADIVRALRDLNVDFNEQMKTAPAHLYPRMRIFEGDSPMAKHRRENPSRKRKYIYHAAEIDLSEFTGNRSVTLAPAP